MATLTAVVAGGKWSSAATWSPEQVPTATDDVVLAATSGSVEISEVAKCRSLDALAYTKTLTMKATIVVGSTTSNGGLAVRLSAAMTLMVSTGANVIEFISTSGVVEKITTAGKEVPGLTFNGTGGVWELQDACDVGNKGVTLKIQAGELITNGQTVQCGICSGVGILTLGSSTLIVESTGNSYTFSGTLNAGTSTIEVLGNSSAAVTTFGGSNKSYNIVKFTGNNVTLTGNNTIAELIANIAAAPSSIKGTTVEKSKTLTVTEGALPSPGEELKGTAIPTGTTAIKVISAELKTVEMSNEATSTVGVAETIEVFKVGLLLIEGKTQTITNFSSNGKVGEYVRITSTVSGKFTTLKKASGAVNSDYLILKDIHTSGTKFYAGANSRDATGNEGWKFEAQPSTSLVLSTGTRTSVSGQRAAKGTSVVMTGVTTNVQGVMIATVASIALGAGAGLVSSAKMVAVSKPSASAGVRITLTVSGKKTVEGVAALTAGAQMSVQSIKVAAATLALTTGARTVVTSAKLAAGTVTVTAGARVAQTSVKIATGQVAQSAGARNSMAGQRVATQTIKLASGPVLGVTSTRIATGTVQMRAGGKIAVTGTRAMQTTVMLTTGTRTAMVARAVLVGSVVTHAGVSILTSRRVTFAGVAHLTSGTRITIAVYEPVTGFMAGPVGLGYDQGALMGVELGPQTGEAR